MTSVDKESPLSHRRILAFLGVNLTFGSLLSVVANLAQLLTITNGLVIFASVFIVSAVYLVRQVWIFQKTQETKIMEVESTRQELHIRLERITVALKTRLDGNPSPDAVVAWVSTKKFLATNKNIQIKEITEDSIILDRGGKDGLVSRIPCKIANKGATALLEQSEIDWVDPDSHQAIVRHSGTKLHRGDNPLKYSIELIIPSITSTEKFIGNILLIAEGFEPDWR